MGPIERNEGFPSHLDDSDALAPPRARRRRWHAVLPRSTWLHLIQGTDPRLTVLNSFFYCDERIRCSMVTSREGASRSPSRGEYERLLYVESGALSVNLTGTGKSLLAGPNELVFLPPFTEHSLQAIGDDPPLPSSPHSPSSRPAIFQMEHRLAQLTRSKRGSAPGPGRSASYRFGSLEPAR